MCEQADKDGFILVSKAKAARRRRNTKTRKGDKEHRQAGAAQEDLGQEDRDKKREELRRRVKFDLSEVEEYASQVLSTLREHHLRGRRVTRLVCLGLGRFSSCPLSRRQLALLLRLMDQLELDASAGEACVAFDPAFSITERDFLTSSGFSVPCANAEGKVGIREGSPPLGDEDAALFFLPHCPRQLANNVLWANWSTKDLGRVLMLCNSFSAVVERTPSRRLKRSGGLILQAVDFVHETPLPGCRPGELDEAFVDTALHSFPSPPAEDWPGWRTADENADYSDDAEFVRG